MIIFDIQDVGARFYTYLSSLFLVMEAAAENGQVVVCLTGPIRTATKSPGPCAPKNGSPSWGKCPCLHGMTSGKWPGCSTVKAGLKAASNATSS